MSLDLEGKKAVVADVAESISGAQAAILAEYRGLTVSQMTGLRADARQAGVFLRIVKNTLTKRAVEGSDFECLQEHLIGPLALAASEDPVAVAKVLSKFAKEHGDLKIVIGAMNGALLSEDEIKVLAKLPGRDELLAQLIGVMQAPVQKLVQTLNEVPGSFVRTLAAVQEAKEVA